MLKRKIFKQVLPIMLSLAMMFQSVPMTALAEEAQLTEETEATVEPVTEAADDLSDSEGDGDMKPGEGMDADNDTDSSEDTGSSKDQPETEANTEAETETETGTENKAEAGKDQESTPTDTGTEADTRVEVSSTEIDISRVTVSGFTPVVSEDDLTYTIPYREENQFDGVMDAVKGTVAVKVNGKAAPSEFKDNYLILEWREAGKTEAMTGMPQNVGSYVLHLQLKAQEGICGDAACDIYFNITPKKLMLDQASLNKVLLSVKAGSSVADFKEAVAGVCKLLDGGDEFKALQYSAEVKVSEVGAAEGTETADAVFVQSKDYRAAINVTFVDAEAGKNYELSGAEYLVNFADLLQTKVETVKPVQEITKTYAKDMKHKASEIAPEIKPEVKVESSKDHEGNLVYGPLPDDVTVKDPIAKWYKKEINKNADGYENGDIADFPTETEVDGITQFFGDDNALYSLMTAEDGTEVAEVGDVGDYYLVFVYEGVEGRYAPSHSDPIKVTISPIEVILKPEKIVGADGTEIKLSAAMTVDDVRSALAKVESKLYLPDAADLTAYGTESDAPVADKDFYGVSYDNDRVTQYYNPVFTLVCKTRNKLPEADWPANAAEDQKWSKWSGLIQTAKIEKDSDSKQYQYYVKFTGYKAVYNTNGVQSSERPITEATDGANRNYKVKTDIGTLGNEKNMLPVVLGEVKETKIDVTPIIAEFNKEGGRGRGGAGLTAGDPAWTIYDADAALFADRASYKKAIVMNADSKVEGTHKDLTYTWETSIADDVVEQYYEITRMKQEEGETAEDFAQRREEAIENLENTFKGGFVKIPQDAGLYRLHVHYEDNGLNQKNMSADGYAYFLIKKQELMLVADTQFAKYGDSVEDFSKTGYCMYMLSNNTEEGWEAEENLLNWQSEHLIWQPMNLKKNADGSDTAEWENSTGTFINKDAPYTYTYKAAVWIDDLGNGYVYDKDSNVVTNKAGQKLDWDNYTTENMEAWDAAEGSYKHHYKVGDGFGDFQFDAAGIKIVVDRSLMPVDKIYDGEPVRPLGDFVKLTDENGTEIPQDKLQINGESKENVGNVRVEWKWMDVTEDDAYWDDKIVPVEEVRFGGTYRLVARFDGYQYADGTSYAPLYGKADGEGPKWLELEDADDMPYELTVSPRKVEITPALQETMTAGDKVSDMMEDHVLFDEGKVSEADRWLFSRGSGLRWNAIRECEEEFDGYPILASVWDDDYECSDCEFAVNYYVDNESVDAEGRIRYGRKYDVTIDDRGLFAQYKYSYDLVYKPAALKTIIRGDADVRSTNFFRDEKYNYVGVSDYRKEKVEGVYEIIPREGIPFIYDNYEFIDHNGYNVTEDIITGKKIPHDKNYIAVNIISPREFCSELGYDDTTFAENNFVYGNSIKSAGGYVIDEYVDHDSDEGIPRYFITVLFPVELDENGKVVEIPAFDVTWEKGYTDTFKFDLANAQLEANLKRAVAPKSLAFNGLQSKMAVGEEQQLDVKITKVQLGDVIRINYRLAKDGDKNVTSNEYASINPETGLITALATNNKKPAAVTVEAYPVRLAADGKTFEEITDTGVKIAKAKVTVTEVTAPVIKKVIPRDISAEVQFTQVKDGYRGEIYVKKFDDKAAANKYKAADFETAIDGMKNDQWKGIFAIQPMYFSGNRGYSEKLKLCRQIFWNLERGFYVVYVRNVSAVRTLADGTRTTESAAGTVKMFETTKSQVWALDPYFEVVDPKTKTNPVRYKNGVDESEGYTVELADKSAQLLVNGQFLDLITVGADKYDKKWYQLSLKEAEKELATKLTDIYFDPALTYCVTDDEAPRFDENRKLKNPSKYVTVNNKGKLTFKGVDKNGELTVRIYVMDGSSWSDNNVYSYDRYGTRGYCSLTVTARPDTVTAKKVKAMKVGDAIRLRDYLEYKAGKAKVPNYWSSDIDIINWGDAEANGFWVYRYGDDTDADREAELSIDSELEDGELIIVAEKEDAKWDLKFKDWLWTSGSEEKVQTEEQSISLQTASLDPVKGLKAVYTDDKHITLNFAHSGHPEAFDIEVRDARGSVVYKRLAYRNNDGMAIVPADLTEWYDPVPTWLPNAITNLRRANLCALDSNEISSFLGDKNFVYFENTKTYAYTIFTEKLMRLSSYKISVTPVYKDTKVAKVATTKAKTTNIPASYQNCDIVDPDYTWGIDLAFNDSEWAYLTSGNTYTVTADAGQLAKERGTDTLTWKSSNTKVASVKANPGSFSATLKALQQGKTTITVTSKVTKKTIARYHIAVKAVGKGTGYGGDYENGGNTFYDDFIITVDPYYEGRIEVLTVSNSVTVKDEDFLNNPSNDRTWVKFTAPSYGEYTFSCDRGYNIYYSNGTGTSGGTLDRYRTLRLEEGQEIYFRVYGSFTLRVSSYVDFTKLTTAFTEDKPLVAGKDGVWVSFTAPEDNYYTFNGDIEKYEDFRGEEIYPVKNSLGMKAGETVFIKVFAYGSLWVTKREFAQTALTTGGSGVNLAITRDIAEDTQYLKFTADITGEHTFTYSPKDKITVTFYGLDDEDEIPTDGTGAVIAKTEALNVGGDTETPAENLEASVKLFIEKGETIAIAVTAVNPSEITDDTKKIDVNVKVAPPVGVKVLIVGEQEVAKATTQMFEYTIPNDKAVAQYVLTATENADITWYYGRTEKDVTGTFFSSSKKLADLSAIADNGDAFKVKDGSVIEPNLAGKKSLHAGDKIYIEVKVSESAAANSKVTLKRIIADGKVFDTAVPATVALGAKQGDAEWYTFKVKKAGYYEFTRKVTVAPETSAAQSVTVATVNEALSMAENGSIDLDDEPVVKKLDVGDYVFMIRSDSDAAAEGDKTTVVLSAKEIVPTALAEGENAVGPITRGETKYYTFKAAKNEIYTINWEPGTDVGTPTVEYTTGNLVSGSYDAFSSVRVNNSDAYTVRLKADDAKDLSGKLIVDVETTEFLKSGVTKEFHIAKDGGVVNYKFTLPEDNVLGYVVTVENTSAADESKGQIMPTITVKAGSSYIVNNLAKGKEAEEVKGWNRALTTKTIEITANNVTEAAEGVTAINATGKITIKPITVNSFVAAVGKVNKGDEPKWYTYSVNADGRYQLDYTVGENQIKESVDVKWYEKHVVAANVDMNELDSEIPYLTKGTELYIRVEAKSTITDTGVDVTLDPKAVTATALTLTDGKAKVDVTAEMLAKGALYYTFEAPAYAVYMLQNYQDTCLYVPEYYDGEESDYWDSGYSLERGQKILIKVTTAGELIITQNAITELKLDTPSGEITLAKDGGSASFVLDIFKDGYYDFRVSDADGLSIERDDLFYQETEGKCYFVADISKAYGDRYEFTVTNSGSEDAKINVTADMLTPVTLEMGETDVPVTKDRASVVEFKTPESYWYTLGCSAGSKMSFADAEEPVEGSKDVFLHKVEAKEDPVFGVLTYSGTEAPATAKVTISKLMPVPADGEKVTVSLEDDASIWYAYKTEKAGNYTFTAPDGVTLSCYSSLKQGYADGSCPPGGSVQIRAGSGADLYIKAVNSSGEKVEGETANITVFCDEATKLDVGENQLSNLQYDMIYMTFAAAEDGMYSFNADGYLSYYGDRAWSGSSQNASSSKSFLVEKGDVVYLSGYGYSDNSIVTVTKTGNAAFLGHVDAGAWEYQWLTFTAPKTGEYTFSSASDDDTYAWFFHDMSVGNNADIETLHNESFDSDDDSGDGNNFSKTLPLAEGETVCIAVGRYGLSGTVSCDVYVQY